MSRQKQEDAGIELGGLDQRQARRLIDRGLRVIAKLIATNWAVEAVPVRTATVAATPNGFQIFVATQRPFVVEMSDPEVEVWSARIGLQPTSIGNTPTTRPPQPQAFSSP